MPVQSIFPTVRTSLQQSDGHDVTEDAMTSKLCVYWSSIVGSWVRICPKCVYGVRYATSGHEALAEAVTHLEEHRRKVAA